MPVGKGGILNFKTFILDMDDVLCRYDRAKRVSILSEMSGLPDIEIDERLWGSGFENEADLGAFGDGASYLAAFGDRLGYPINRSEWITARAQSITPYQSMLQIVDTLKSHAQVAVLTNNVSLLEETLGEVFPQIGELFGEKVYFSCNFGIGKPDPEIYCKVAELCACEPRDCLFTDDKAENAEGARQAGMSAIHFTDPALFAGQLKLAGISL